jgi:nicotinate-nucleotide--dimethylbenzimidazole phosphoribosyltransferase
LVRFFAHDGKSTHGPAGIEELLKLPGFDGDTLVCPVGSDDSADWKPALAYAPFKKALLEAPLPAPAPNPAPVPPQSLSLDLPKANQIPVPAPFPLPLPALPATPSLPAMAAPLPVPPAPAPVVKTVPCPRCAHANLEEARFCNSCGARMDGRLEDISAPPPSVPAPAPILPQPSAPKPEPEPAPAEPPKDPFAHLDPLLSYPTEPAPMALPESPRRPLKPGKMGQLGDLEGSAPASSFDSPSPAPALAPEPAPAAAAAAVPVWKRPPVLAAFAGAAVLSAGLGYMMLNKSVPAEPVAELTPSAPAPEPAPPVIYTPPPVTSSPAMPAPSASKPKKTSQRAAPPAAAAPSAAAKPRRARKPRPARAPKPEAALEAPPSEAQGGGDTFIESRAPEPKGAAKRSDKPAVKDPLLEALLSDATQPSAEAAAEPLAAPAAEAAAEKAPPAIGQRPAAKPGQFSLPGLKRPVSASDRAAAPAARAPLPPVEDAATGPIAGLDAAPLSEPGKTAPPPGIEDQPAKAADDFEGDQLALVQVHEQFDFCAQLLAQGAFGDHYDTCLCKDTREAAPIRGRRGFYVTAKKKEAGGGHLETSAKILSSKIEAGTAMVTARWKSGGDDKGRTATQNWRLEDGLWCQAP